jgi:hypothetical protein
LFRPEQDELHLTVPEPGDGSRASPIAAQRVDHHRLTDRQRPHPGDLVVLQRDER